VGCGVAHGGFVGWLTVVVSIFGRFQWFWVWVFFVFCFTLLQTHNVKYLLDYFPKCKQTLEKQSFSLKSFAFANILQWKIIYSKTNGAQIMKE
jgi:hypothetical protein